MVETAKRKEPHDKRNFQFILFHTFLRKKGNNKTQTQSIMNLSELSDVRDHIHHHNLDVQDTIKDISEMMLKKTGIHVILCLDPFEIQFPTKHDEVQFDSLVHWDLIFSFLWGEMSL
jgi:hypothetical protein